MGEVLGVWGAVWAAAGDTDSDGDCDQTDRDNIDNWTSGYDVRYDVNLDGSINSTDSTAATDLALGWGELSGIRSRRSYTGLTWSATGDLHARHRLLATSLGRWVSRDPMGYIDGVQLYQYVQSASLTKTDPLGLSCDAQITVLSRPTGQASTFFHLPESTLEKFTAQSGDCDDSEEAECSFGLLFDMDIYYLDPVTSTVHEVLQDDSIFNALHGPNNDSIQWKGTSWTKPVGSLSYDKDGEHDFTAAGEIATDNSSPRFEWSETLKCGESKKAVLRETGFQSGVSSSLTIWLDCSGCPGAGSGTPGPATPSGGPPPGYGGPVTWTPGSPPPQGPVTGEGRGEVWSQTGFMKEGWTIN